MNNKPKVICVMGKSGTGKSTLQTALSTIMNDIFYNVKSKTTRKERPYDLNDKNTHVFVSEEEYLSDLKNNKIIALYKSPKGYYSYTTKSCFSLDKINLYSIDSIEYNNFIRHDEFNTCGAYLDITEKERALRFLKRGENNKIDDENHLSYDNIKDISKVSLIQANSDIEETIKAIRVLAESL